MVPTERIIIVDFGGQYAQLIARRVRECGVYSKIVSYTRDLDEILAEQPQGIIFTGGPASVYDLTPAFFRRASRSSAFATACSGCVGNSAATSNGRLPVNTAMPKCRNWRMVMFSPTFPRKPMCG